MNVFIIGTPLETAKKLDKRRLNKQIIECGQILKAITGDTKAWVNHPVTKMYKYHQDWLFNYMKCLDAYRNGDIVVAKIFNACCRCFTPEFHCQSYFDQMKRRLYTKNCIHYEEYSHLGKSETNWYYVDNEWRYYKNGKLINV